MKKKILNSCLVILLMFLFGSLAACSPKIIQTEKNHFEKDSIFYSTKLILKDTTIFIKGDTIKQKIPIHYLSEIPIKTQTNRGALSISKVNDTIIAQCEISDLKEQITLLHKEIVGLKIQTKSTNEATIIQKKYIPNWIIYLALAGFICFLFLVILLNKQLKL